MATRDARERGVAMWREARGLLMVHLRYKAKGSDPPLRTRADLPSCF
jgi:hypothetical protein